MPAVRGVSHTPVPASLPAGRAFQLPTTMSLAVSAVIAPSRRLRLLLAAFCACLCAASCAVGLVVPDRFAASGAVACALLLAAFAPGWHALRLTRRWPGGSASHAAAVAPHTALQAGANAGSTPAPGNGLCRIPARIFAGFSADSLSRSGAILPTIATVRRIDISGVGQLRVTVQQGVGCVGMPMALLPGATAWPCCMLLRLRAEDGTVHSLVLLPDSVADGGYRALTVAVRALASAASDAGPGAGPGQLASAQALQIL